MSKAMLEYCPTAALDMLLQRFFKGCHDVALLIHIYVISHLGQRETNTQPQSDRDIHNHRQTDKQTDTQTNRQTDRQTQRDTNTDNHKVIVRHTNTDRQINR